MEAIADKTFSTTIMAPSATTASNLLEALQPFLPDDSCKGTYLLLRIAGVEESTALRISHHKARTLKGWRSTDVHFRTLDNAISILAQRFGGEARVIRSALLDIYIIETGISIFRKITNDQPVTDHMWSYATKLAGLRIPLMDARTEAGDSWQRLADSVRNTLAQREITVTQDWGDGKESITAKETVVRGEEPR